jgi:ankyrin repeat protein
MKLSIALSDAEKIKQYHAMLYARIERHDHSAIRKILNMAPNLINSKDQSSLTPLMFACEEENLEIINLLSYNLLYI